MNSTSGVTVRAHQNGMGTLLVDDDDEFGVGLTLVRRRPFLTPGVLSLLTSFATGKPRAAQDFHKLCDSGLMCGSL